MVRFLRASSYQDGHLLSLPINPGGLDAAVTYYQTLFGMAVVSRSGAAIAATARAALRRCTRSRLLPGGPCMQKSWGGRQQDADRSGARPQARGSSRPPPRCAATT